MKQLIEISRYYGKNQEYVLIGGGNTSWKEDGRMYVKASGYSLGNIDETGFVTMDMNALQDVWNKDYPQDDKQREQDVLQDMMNARMPGEHGRPSVEALLHSFIPSSFVVHLHPALVNGMTCGKDGRQRAVKLFGDAMAWVPCVDPGYTLAREARNCALEHQRRCGFFPDMLLLENHGVFIGGDTAEEVGESYESLMQILQAEVQREPDLTPHAVDPAVQRIVGEAASAVLPGDVRAVGTMNKELQRFLHNRACSVPISSAFTPDHIVYSGHKPLWIGLDVLHSPNPVEAVSGKFEAFLEEEGSAPKTVLFEQTGMFGIGSSVREAESACLVFLDTVKVAVYSESFGGPSFMPDQRIDFIRNWEVEQYRSKVQQTKKQD